MCIAKQKKAKIKEGKSKKPPRGHTLHARIFIGNKKNQMLQQTRKHAKSQKR